MTEEKVRIVAVATRIREDEAEAIDALALGGNRAETLRVLLRFAMERVDEVRDWLGDGSED